MKPRLSSIAREHLANMHLEALQGIMWDILSPCILFKCYVNGHFQQIFFPLLSNITTAWFYSLPPKSKLSILILHHAPKISSYLELYLQHDPH